MFYNLCGRYNHRVFVLQLEEAKPQETPKSDDKEQADAKEKGEDAAPATTSEKAPTEKAGAAVAEEAAS